MSKNWWMAIIGGFIALIGCGVCLLLVFVMSQGGDSTTRQQNEPEQNYQIGQDVIVGKVRWKVLAAEDLGAELKSDNQFIDSLTTAGHFVRVRVEVENRAANARTFTEGDIADDQGRTFGDSSDAIHFIEDSELCILERLNPNVPRVCTAIYEIPMDATALKLVVGDLAPFGDEASIDLNLR